MLEKMKTIYSSEHLFMVERIKDIVESHGIECILKNSYLSGGAGEIPPTETWPRLFVVNETDYDRAIKVVDDELKSMNTDDNDDKWTCSKCGEKVDSVFTLCWNCNTEKENV